MERLSNTNNYTDLSFLKCFFIEEIKIGHRHVAICKGMQCKIHFKLTKIIHNLTTISVRHKVNDTSGLLIFQSTP